MADSPYVNGIYYDFATIEVMIDGVQRIRIKGINYSDNCEPGKVKGTAPWLLGRTTGDYEASGDIELYADSDVAVREGLSNGFLTKEFPIVVNYAPSGQPMITDTLYKCRFSSTEASRSNGTDGLTYKHKLSITKIRWNGLDPLPDMPD